MSSKSYPVNKRTPPLLVIGVAAAALLLSFAISLFARAITTSTAGDGPSQAGVAQVQPPHLLQDFMLTNHQGEPMRLSDLRGRPVLMFFGYTHCPDVCPLTLANFRQVAERLGDDASDVAFLFVTIDAQRDTPEVVANYLAQFSDAFIGMIGESAVLNRIAPDYGLTFDAAHADHDHAHHQGADDEYLVNHTSPAFLVDRDGYLRTVFFQGTTVDAMTDAVQAVRALPTQVAAFPTTRAAASPVASGDPAEGARLFAAFQPVAGIACATCHHVNSEERLIGPGLLNVAARAVARREGQNAADYLRESILEPGAYVVEGYQDIMPKNWDTVFNAQQVDDLVAYLLTLGV